ncbi:SRPBCC family protein [Ekhidna sp.]|uniref:SRPBCC family protein n=1 Tax=Ekhidna sp. TaxID=2608089 RepID=UPI00329A5D12
MPRLTVERSIKINAPAEVVYSALNDFNKWIKWSPWLIIDPDAEVDVAADAKSYTWKGDRVGEGNMKVREEEPNKYIVFDLNFLKPWKSVSSTKFVLNRENDGTEVTWSMDSTLPFFIFWMKKMMTAYVGADYERGLDMLKAYVEEGEVLSKLDFEGFSSFDGGHWIGIKTSCGLDTIATQVEADYAILRAYADGNIDAPAGNFFTIYHKWDIIRDSVAYTAAMPVSEIPKTLPDNLTSGQIPSIKVYRLKHTGAYKHLGNAWSAGYTMMRNKEFKHLKKVDPFEVYHNNPQETKEKDLVTVLHFPVK